MSGAVISSNTSLKVNRAITSTTTVNANCFAVVNYIYSGMTAVIGTNEPNVQPIITRTFGAGQSIPSTLVVAVHSGNGDEFNVTWALSSGFELINSP